MEKSYNEIIESIIEKKNELNKKGAIFVVYYWQKILIKEVVI